MKTLAHFLLQPVLIGLFLLLAGLLLSKWDFALLGRLLWFLAGLWFFLMLFTPVPQWFVRQREQRFSSLREIPAFQEPPQILVLASGFTHDTSLVPTNQLGGTMLQRVVEGYRLYRHIPGAQLILSGPKGERSVSQASVARAAALDLGAVPQDCHVLEHPENTWQEAQLFAARYYHKDRPVILVSSAVHLPRAVYLFQKLGIEVRPAPTAHLVKTEAHEGWRWEPGFSGLSLMRRYLHEKVGEGYARYGLKK